MNAPPSGPEAAVIQITAAEWPADLTRAVLDASHALAATQEGQALTLAVPNPPADFGFREALREALRSLVHGSVLERPKMRVNLVFGGDAVDHQATVDYIGSAPFVIGATVDLGEAS